MKRSLWGKGIRASALVLAVAAAMAACVEPDPPSVAISKKKASLVFGVTVNEPVKPVTEQLPPLGDLEDLTDLFDVEEEEEIDLSGPVAPIAPKEECPKAELTAFAEKPAQNFNERPVPVGSYRWVVNASVTQGPITQTASRFERRAVIEYRVVNANEHQFKLRYRLPDPTKLAEDTYRVVTNGRSVGTTDGVNTAVSGPRVGENDRGLLLIHRKVIDSKGATVSEFAPTTGILLLPLPVTPGEEWSSTGVDPRSGQTIVHRAKTINTQRIDACGEVVDGWAVEATQTYADRNGSAEVKYDYAVATQYGSMPIKERFRQTVAGTAVDITYQLGQVKPDPAA